ncbi:ATP-binding cassette domain-containing protein [Pseudomonadales bacterium]|nr:ATP-binding cassette domain-containing protein [Pseudomonadales bacterium]
MIINDENLRTGFYLDNKSILVGAWNLLDGPSGAGKTTLLKEFVRQLVADGQTKVAFVPQRPVIIPGTVVDNIRFFRNVTDVRINDLMNLVGLNDSVSGKNLKDNGFPLSGGEIQRMVLARAVAEKIGLLVLDESFSAIDNVLAQKIINKIKETGVTAVFTSHSESLKTNANNKMTLMKC